jgi:hypothetical protein
MGGTLARMDDVRNVYRILVGKYVENISLAR